ncbi:MULTISPECIES: APC family permease [Metallosphaera]|uniref:Amino acid/polyamine/organocation transporter, APC superfamily n=4 Tax=Metallosphaera TaxID=41980 RepID=A4YHS1_METS5|nr:MULTISPECIES: APC family permease [Metallosphaera]ABP95973.1 amino acid/polyamine/organocation transporter, APC superfamily [Metallosphaera sedula DSM 5348]AIM27957.1 amino acid/polyamine/organocation transporter, APC superfamily [Metallosphaera sedula]AKV74790.1 amino acid permease [Metallosphaera sedula]AKV77026.1 amino acid permease [Metallosphaera sedula]AKV79278.1 amino acid permease [Metallosphaera sedula]
MDEKKKLENEAQPSLKKDVLGTWLVASYGIAANAPIAVATLYFVGIAGIAGGAMPLVVLLSYLIYATTLIVIYEWSKDVASSYGYVAIMKKGLNSSLAAFTVGYGYIYQYLVAGTAGFGILGLASFLYLISPSIASTMPWLWALITVILTLEVTLVMWLGVKPGGLLNLVIGLFSIGFLVVTSISLIAVAGSHNTVSVFTASPVNNNWVLILVSMIFAITTFGGATTPIGVAEEAKVPKRTMPRALLLGFGLLGVGLILNSYAQTVIYGVSNMFNYASLPDPMVIIYSKYFSPVIVDLLIVLVAFMFNSSIISFATSGSRMIYGMARDGILYPSNFSKVNRHGAPGNAIILTGVIAGALCLLTGYLLGPLEASIFLITFGSFYVSLGHLFAALALIRRKVKLGRPDIAKHVLIPIISMGAYVATIYFGTYPAPAFPLNIAVYSAWAVLAVHVVVYYLMKRRYPERLSKFGDHSL